MRTDYDDKNYPCNPRRNDDDDDDGDDNFEINYRIIAGKVGLEEAKRLETEPNVQDGELLMQSAR